MIDTDKYEGHTPAAWMRRMNLNGLYSHILFTCTHAERWLIEDAPLLLEEVKRLGEIEQEWLMMWATLEELNLVADVRKNMTEHGFTFPTDEDVIE